MNAEDKGLTTVEVCFGTHECVSHVCGIDLVGICVLFLDPNLIYKVISSYEVPLGI